jgi:hypothetical protein
MSELTISQIGMPGFGWEKAQNIKLGPKNNFWKFSPNIKMDSLLTLKRCINFVN